MNTRRRTPDESASVACPACARRPYRIVAADCPICHGLSKLHLGRAALLRYPKEVVSRAVEYALEAQAGQDLGNVSYAQARRNLTAMVVKLAKAGLLHPGVLPDDEPNAVHAAMAHLQARHLAAKHGGLPIPPGTAANLDAPPVEYEPGQIPVNGTLPNFSKAGFLCMLARVCDPVDPLEVHTPDAPGRRALERQGDILGHAVSHHR